MDARKPEDPRRPESPGLLPKHGGYRSLRSFIAAERIYDATARFCDRFIERGSRLRDQMIQAARSGRQNIAEASLASGTSKKTELKLTNVAKASLGELLLDYEDFLRQRRLAVWDKNEPRARAVRRAYRFIPDPEWSREKSDGSDKSDRYDRSDKSDRSDRLDRSDTSDRSAQSDKSDKSERSDQSGRSHRSDQSDRFDRSDRSEPSDKSERSDQSDRSDRSGRQNSAGNSDLPPFSADPYGIAVASPEAAANTIICLIHQAMYLLKRQIETLSRDFLEQGGITERLYHKRVEFRDRAGK